METNVILNGDVLQELNKLPDNSVDCIVTSPPYWGLRDYGVPGQLGLELSLQAYIDNMLKVTAELKRVLKQTGVMFWNHGDCYGGLGHSDWKVKTENWSRQGGWGSMKDKKSRDRDFRLKRDVPAKCLALQAYRLAIRMIDEQGWIMRNEIIWYKPNAMPSSAKDRFGVDFEPVFFFTKSKKYNFMKVKEPSVTGRYVDFNVRVRDVSRGYKKSGQYRASESEIEQYHGQGIITNPLRGKRCVWTVPTKGVSDAHFATFPVKLIEPMIKAGCPAGGIVLDPFFGAGTVGIVALIQGKKFVGVELNPEYVKIAEKRLQPYLVQERLIKVEVKGV